MGRHDYLIGTICFIASPILFFTGLIYSLYPQSFWEGTPDPIKFWSFTSVSIIMFIAGFVFVIKGSQRGKGEKILAESRLTKLVESNKDSETFDSISTICPYCGSTDINNTLIEKANNIEEQNTLGFIEKYLFNCDACKSTWFVVEK